MSSTQTARCRVLNTHYDSSVRIRVGQHLPFDPFDGKPFRLRVGARPLDPSTWIVLDERTDDELSEKQRLLNESTDRYHACVALPQDEQSHHGAHELCGAVENYLRAYEPEHYARWAPRITFVEPIVRAGLLTPEDWCILTRSSPSEPLRLTTALLCFPNRWRLHEKIGLPMTDIHRPVPGYAEALGRPSDSTLDRLTPQRPIWRLNWSVEDIATLHQPTGHFDANAGSRVVDVGSDVVLRVERQTLISLPESQAVVFGIRTIVRSLSEVITSDPSSGSRMATALQTLPEGLRSYKSLGTLGPVVIQWLQSHS
jgi:dimethylamine monooxygenase subunit A